MPGVKNSRPNGLIDIKALNNRVMSTTDNTANFYGRFTDIHSYIFQDVETQDISEAVPLFIGPVNSEIAFQVIGDAVPVIKASLDGDTYVDATTTITSDGIRRITHFYRYLKFGLTVNSGTASLYMSIS